MIILRQKNYSSLMTKVLYKAGKAKNKLITLPARLQKNLHSSGLYKDLNKRHLADSRIKEGTKSNIQLKREAIKDSNKLRASMLEAANASTTKQGISEYAGKKAGDFVELASENPITAASVAVGYGSTPAQLYLGQYWGPIGEVGAAGEAALKRVSQKYKKLTKKTSEISNKRRWKEKTNRAVQSVLTTML